MTLGTIKVRQSNLECLRIIAMLMILMLHANFYASGMPDNVLTEFHPSIFIQTMVAIFCSVGVNVFILISGYFSIKCSLKGALRFIYTCLFYSCGIFLILYLFGVIQISTLGLAECFYLRKINWFPKAYLGLFILAPILNTYVNNISKSSFKNTLVAFFVFQTIFGTISDATHFISFGYSTFSFIGIYLTGRYIRLYPPRLLKFGFKVNLSLYLGISMILSIIGYYLICNQIFSAFYRIEAYCNPFVILATIFLFNAFLKLKFQNRFINKIAVSCFAVYLLHSNPNIIFRYYTATVKAIHEHYIEYELLLIPALVLTFFIMAVIVDQVRILSWNYFEKSLWPRISHRCISHIIR